MASALAVESLKPNRSLIDPKFEGYKLSVEPLSVNSTQLISLVNEVPLREDIFSLQHLRAFGNHNHLVVDLWSEEENEESVYYVDEDLQVQQVLIKVSIITAVLLLLLLSLIISETRETRDKGF